VLPVAPTTVTRAQLGLVDETFLAASEMPLNALARITDHATHGPPNLAHCHSLVLKPSRREMPSDANMVLRRYLVVGTEQVDT
jgi:hypothetical protein